MIFEIWKLKSIAQLIGPINFDQLIFAHPWNHISNMTCRLSFYGGNSQVIFQLQVVNISATSSMVITVRTSQSGYNLQFRYSIRPIYGTRLRKFLFRQQLTIWSISYRLQKMTLASGIVLRLPVRGRVQTESIEPTAWNARTEQLSAF